MNRVLLVLLLAPAAARAAAGLAIPPAIMDVDPSGAAQRQPVSLVLQPLCDPTAEPAAWRDVSNALLFASHPLQQLSADDRAFLYLAPLVELRFAPWPPRLFLVGAPAQSWGRLRLQPGSGWHVAGC